MTTIGDVTERISTWNPSKAREPSSFEYIDLSAVDNGLKAITAPTQLFSAEAPSRARQIVATGDVLVSTVRPNLNAVAVVPPALDGATASTGFTVLRPTDRVFGRYLFHWVRSDAFITDMVRKATGASYPAVSDRIVKESLLPLPPLDEQRRIAAVLDQVDALRAKRLQALEHLDDLAQSIFLDLFGHPLSNPRAWPMKPIGELGKVTTGKTPPTTSPGMFDGPVPFVTPGDLNSMSPVKRTVTDAGAARSRTVRPGATLVCCIGATIGKVGRAEMTSAFNQQINAIEWGPEVDDAYGFMSMRFRKTLVARLGASTTLPLLPKSQFVKILLPVPPIAMQRAFSDMLTTLADTTVLYSTQSKQLDSLVESLQSRAFAGLL